MPYESVLGSLLFRLYINELQTYLPDNVFHLLYANDLKFHFQVSQESMPPAIEKHSLIFGKISDWPDSALLRLNYE